MLNASHRPALAGCPARTRSELDLLVLGRPL